MSNSQPYADLLYEDSFLLPCHWMCSFWHFEGPLVFSFGVKQPIRAATAGRKGILYMCWWWGKRKEGIRGKPKGVVVTCIVWGAGILAGVDYSYNMQYCEKLGNELSVTWTRECVSLIGAQRSMEPDGNILFGGG